MSLAGATKPQCFLKRDQPNNKPSPRQGWCIKYYQIGYTPISMDWFKGKFTGNHRFSHEIWGFPVDFPLNQSIDHLFLGRWLLWLHMTPHLIGMVYGSGFDTRETTAYRSILGAPTPNQIGSGDPHVRSPVSEALVVWEDDGR